jgi:hypothetical protein
LACPETGIEMRLVDLTFRDLTSTSLKPLGIEENFRFERGWTLPRRSPSMVMTIGLSRSFETVKEPSNGDRAAAVLTAKIEQSTMAMAVR